mgnify:CR=1 FL=1
MQALPAKSLVGNGGEWLAAKEVGRIPSGFHIVTGTTDRRRDAHNTIRIPKYYNIRTTLTETAAADSISLAPNSNRSRAPHSKYPMQHIRSRRAKHASESITSVCSILQEYLFVP